MDRVKMDKNEQLIDDVLKTAMDKVRPDGRGQLTCAQAFGFVKKYNVKISDIGRICNQNNIRICKCQLGCFK